MNAQAILDDLHRRGVSFSVNGDTLRTRGPVGAVTQADLAALRKVKAEAMVIIREEEADRIEERGAIIEFCAFKSRREAERLARDEQHPGTAA